MFPEKHKFVLPEFLDTSRGEIIKQEGAIARPDKAAYLKIQMFKNAADFPVLAFGQCHFHPLIASGAAFHIRIDLAIADAFDLDAFDQLLNLGFDDFSVISRAIGAPDAGGGYFHLPLQPPIPRARHSVTYGKRLSVADSL